MRLRAAALGSAVVIAACVSSGQFDCNDDVECSDSGVDGWCEDSGFCSFPDDTCDSGRRYGSLSGSLSSGCVPVGSETESTGSTTNIDPTSDAEADSGSAEADSTGIEVEPSIVAEPTARRQTMDGMGVQAWDFPYASRDGWNWGVVKSVFDEIDINYVMMIVLFNRWEPSNDNVDPQVADWAAFDPDMNVALEDAAFATWLSGRGYEVLVQKVALPGWLSSGVVVNPGMGGEFAESVVTYMVNLEQAGAPQPAADVWIVQPDGETAFPGPEATVGAAKQILTTAGIHDLSTQLIGPNAPVSIAVDDDWISTWFGDQTLRSNTRALAVRGNGSEDIADFEAVGEAAVSLGYPTWAVDNWYCTAEQGCAGGPEHDSKTWATAWEQARSNYRLIAHARASRVYHADLLGYQPAIEPDTGIPRPPYHVLKHFANYIPAGAVLLTSTSDHADVLPMVFELPDGGYSAVLLNVGDQEAIVRLAVAGSDPLSASAVVQTTEGSYFATVEVAEAVDGWPLFTLPAQSLTSALLP